MQCRLLKCKVVNASVDWITCTASSRDAKRALWKVGERVLNRRESEGENTSRWHANGYQGWSNGATAMGVRKDGCILRISGEEASHEWRDAFAASENCSRLDFAVDCYSDPPVPALSRNIYRDIRHVRPLNGRPPTRSLILSGDGGSTVYVGARTSEQYGRVYDKGIESKTRPAGSWWRWEVEYKGKLSWLHGSALMRTDDQGVAIMSNNAHWFRTRTLHSYPATSVPLNLFVSKDSTSVDRQLSWLARGVRPTVQALIERLGESRVLFALGFPPQSAVRSPEPPTITQEVA